MRPRPPLPNHHLSWHLRVTNTVHSPNHLYLWHTRPDHILCRIEHQKLFRSIRSLPHFTLPWFHGHFSSLHQNPITIFPVPKNCSTLSETRLHIFKSQAQIQHIYLDRLRNPHTSEQSVTPFPYLFSDGSCPDQYHVYKTLPAGAFLKALFLISMARSALSLSKSMDLTNTAEIQAPFRTYCIYATSSTPSSTYHFPLGFPIRHWAYSLGSLFPLPISNSLFFYLTSIITWLHEHTYENPVVQNYCRLVKLIGFSSLNFETGVSPKNCYFTIVDLHLEWGNGLLRTPSLNPSLQPPRNSEAPWTHRLGFGNTHGLYWLFHCIPFFMHLVPWLHGERRKRRCPVMHPIFHMPCKWSVSGIFPCSRCFRANQSYNRKHLEKNKNKNAIWLGKTAVWPRKTVVSKSTMFTHWVTSSFRYSVWQIWSIGFQYRYPYQVFH